MNRWALAGVIAVGLGAVAQHSTFAQNAVDENGNPIPRAVPVEKPSPRAVPAGKATPKPAKPVKPSDVPPSPEPDEPGTIRVAPMQNSGRTVDQVQLDIADGYYARKMYEQAAPEYEKYLGLYPTAPDRPQALFRLGESYRHNGSLNAAKNAYETLLAQFSDGDFIGPAAYRLAEIYYEEKNYRDAVILYRKASVRLKDPAVANAAKFFTARSLEATGEKVDARMVYEDLVGATENNPFRDASQRSLALLLKDSGRTAEALRQMQALAKHTENPDLKVEALVYCGIWELELTPPQVSPAEADFKAALAVNVQSHWKDLAQLELQRVNFTLGKYQEIIDFYEKDGAGLAADVKPEMLMLVGNSYRQLGKTADAMKFFDQVMKESPNSDFAKDAQFARLKVLYATDDASLLAEIDKYIAANPEGSRRDEALLMKAEIYFKKQDYQNAMPIYSTLELSRQLTGNRKAEVLFRLGWCQMQMHNMDHAVKAFTSFIDGYPGNALIPYALIQRGIAYQSQKALAPALKDYDALIKNYPKAREREVALQQKALIQGQHEDNNGMVESFRLLLKDYPETAARPQADYWIGRIAFDGKRYKEAVPYLEEARKLDADQFWEKASICLLYSQYSLEDKAGASQEADLYSKKGKAQVPAEILRWLGKDFSESGDFASAQKWLKMLTGREEAMPEDFLALGKTEHSLGKDDAAVSSLKTYLKSIKLPRPRSEGLLILATSQIGTKTLEDAQASVDEAIILEPEGEMNGRARIVAGDIQMARHNFAEAAKIYESVAVILDDPEVTPAALEKAVEAWKAAGDEQRSKKILNTLKSRYPEYLQHKEAAPAKK